jgi:hypothetical protein
VRSHNSEREREGREGREEKRKTSDRYQSTISLDISQP